MLSRVHSVGQCAECEIASSKKPGGRCAAHSAPKKQEEAYWWHAPQADPGAALILADAERKEAEHLAKEADSGWRTEWRPVRAEQLHLQDEAHGAVEQRLRPGGPESLDWVTNTFEHQISLLVREAGFVREQSVGYTLLACGGVGALGRAAQEADGSPEADYPLSRALIGKVLCSRATNQAEANARLPPHLFANINGPVGLLRSDPAWAALKPDAQLGLQFTTSALVMTNDSVEAFVNNREKHDCLARSGVREWVAGDSDIVCFVSEPPAAAAAEDQAQVVVQQVASPRSPNRGGGGGGGSSPNRRGGSSSSGGGGGTSPLSVLWSM